MARYPAVPRGPASRLKGGALPPLLHTACNVPFEAYGRGFGNSCLLLRHKLQLISQACLSCRASSLYFKQASR